MQFQGLLFGFTKSNRQLDQMKSEQNMPDLGTEEHPIQVHLIQEQTTSNQQNNQQKIDVHDKRLSQLFKVLYVAAAGFWYTLHETVQNGTSNNISNTTVAIPAIMAGLLLVIIWIVLCALREGQCYSECTNTNITKSLQKANVAYSNALIMIRVALFWILTICVTSAIALDTIQFCLQWTIDNAGLFGYMLFMSWIIPFALRFWIPESKQKYCTTIMYMVWCITITQSMIVFTYTA